MRADALCRGGTVLRAAIRGWEASLSPSHPHLALGLWDWAIDAAAAGHLDLAAELVARAVRIQEASLPPENPALLFTRQIQADVERKRKLSTTTDGSP